MSDDKDNDSAVGALMAAKAEFDSIVNSLSAMSEDHFGVLPDDVNWGHVGSVSEAIRLLREAEQWLQADQPSAVSK